MRRRGLALALCASAWIIESNSPLTGQTQSGSTAEWDVLEAGLVSVIARGNQALQEPPAVQLVAAPVELALTDAASVNRTLGELADTIPEGGPYFVPSGRTVRQEYSRLLKALSTAQPAVQVPSEPIPTDATAFRFNPDVPGLVARGMEVVPRSKVEWAVEAGAGTQGVDRRTRRIRIRVGRLSVRAARLEVERELTADSVSGGFSADGLAIINVIPGRWFSEQVLRRMRTQVQSEQWWAQAGRFALYPRAFVVMSSPSFKLRFDPKSYRALKTAVEGGLSISIGPIAVGGSGSTTKISFDDASSSVSARATGPVVVAVLNQVNSR